MLVVSEYGFCSTDDNPVVSPTNRYRRVRRISSLAGSDANFSRPGCEPATDLFQAVVVSWLARSIACAQGLTESESARTATKVGRHVSVLVGMRADGTTTLLEVSLHG